MSRGWCDLLYGHINKVIGNRPDIYYSYMHISSDEAHFVTQDVGGLTEVSIISALQYATKALES